MTQRGAQSVTGLGTFRFRGTRVPCSRGHNPGSAENSLIVEGVTETADMGQMLLRLSPPTATEHAVDEALQRLAVMIAFPRWIVPSPEDVERRHRRTGRGRVPR